MKRLGRGVGKVDWTIPFDFVCTDQHPPTGPGNLVTPESPMQTLMIYKLVFNQNYYTFTLILLINIVV